MVCASLPESCSTFFKSSATLSALNRGRAGAEGAGRAAALAGVEGLSWRVVSC